MMSRGEHSPPHLRRKRLCADRLVETSKRVGQAIAERALAAGVSSVVFDRGGYLYHGRVRALTDAARAAGLNREEAVAVEENAEPVAVEQPEKSSKKKKK